MLQWKFQSSELECFFQEKHEKRIYFIWKSDLNQKLENVEIEVLIVFKKQARVLVNDLVDWTTKLF